MSSARKVLSRGRCARWLALGLILLLGFGLRLFQLDQQSLWWDEIATLNRAVMPFDALVANLLAKTDQVPLYFLLMRLWVIVGTSEFVLRFFSVIWGVLSIALLFRVGSQLGGAIVGLAAAFLLAISPFHIWYSQEARTYSLLLFLILLAHWFLFRILRYNHLLDWIGYTCCLALALFSHYFTLWILVAHYLFFALHFRRHRLPFGRWLAAAGVVGMLFLVWLAFFWVNGREQLTAPFWIPYARWYDPFLTILALSAGRTIDPSSIMPLVVLVVYLAGLAVAFVFGVRQPGTNPSAALPGSEIGHSTLEWLRIRVLFFWLAVPLAITWLISLPWPMDRKITIYNDRYLIIILPALILLTAWGLKAVARRSFSFALLPVSLAIVAVACLPALVNLYVQPEYARQGWRDAVAHLRATAEPGEILLTLNDSRLPLIYYPVDHLSVVELPPAPGDSDEFAAFDVNMIDLVSHSTRKSDRLWLLTVNYNIDPHGFSQARNQAVIAADQINPYRIWLADHASVLDDWQFPGIRVSRYELWAGE